MTFRGIRSLLLAATIAMASATPARAQATTGTITADGGSVVFDNSVSASFLPAGYVTLGIQTAGTWTGTIEIEGSVDCTTYRALDVSALSGSSTVSSATANGTWRASIAGLTCVRMRANGAWTGTAIISFRGSAGGGGTGSASISGEIEVGIEGFSTEAKQDTGNASIASIDTKTPALGQALAAASTPVVLTASQLSTLTPPAAITGFATAAKQPALGVAGSPSTDVITVQGHASGTPIPVGLGSGAATAANQSSEITSLQIIDDLPAVIGAKTDAKSTATDTTSVSAMQVWKQISASIQAFGAAAAAASNMANPTAIGVLAYSMCHDGSLWDPCAPSDGGAGAVSSNTTRTVEGSDSPVTTALQLIDDAQTGDSVNYRTSAGSTEDETEIKATPGRLFSVAITNTNAAARYFRCYNLTAANTTPGSSTVFIGLAVPGATTGAGFTHTFGPNGIAFSVALTCTLTTGAADSDTAEVAANEMKWIISYKD